MAAPPAADPPKPATTTPDCASVPGATPRFKPGAYQQGTVIYDANNLMVKLTGIEVTSDCMLIAHVAYTGEASSVKMTCTGYSNPAIDILTLGSGTRIPASQTYCSANPDTTTTLPRGGTLQYFAIFPISHRPAEPLQLDWQYLEEITGAVYNISIP